MVQQHLEQEIINVLIGYNVQKDSESLLEYERGKKILYNYYPYSDHIFEDYQQAIKILAEWVGV